MTDTKPEHVPDPTSPHPTEGFYCAPDCPACAADAEATEDNIIQHASCYYAGVFGSEHHSMPDVAEIREVVKSVMEDPPIALAKPGREPQSLTASSLEARIAHLEHLVHHLLTKDDKETP